jgi:hypothetical protein
MYNNTTQGSRLLDWFLMMFIFRSLLKRYSVSPLPLRFSFSVVYTSHLFSLMTSLSIYILSLPIFLSYERFTIYVLTLMIFVN